MLLVFEIDLAQLTPTGECRNATASAAADRNTHLTITPATSGSNLLNDLRYTPIYTHATINRHICIQRNRDPAVIHN